MKTLIIKIFGRDKMTYNGENAVILNNVKQYILKDILAKLSFGLKIREFYLYIIEYRADLMHSFYRVYTKVETYLDVLNAKDQMQKELKL